MMGLIDVDRSGILQTEEAYPLMRLRFSELDSDGYRAKCRAIAIITCSIALKLVVG